MFARKLGRRLPIIIFIIAGALPTASLAGPTTEYCYSLSPVNTRGTERAIEACINGDVPPISADAPGVISMRATPLDRQQNKAAAR